MRQSPTLRVGVQSWVAISCLLCACQSPHVEFGKQPEHKSTWGEVAHAIALSNAEAAEQCSLPYQELFHNERDVMVSSIDGLLTNAIVDDLPSLLAGGILPSFDEGDLPTLTHALGDSLQLLIDDSLDPDRLALQGVSDLLHTQTILQDDHILELARALAADPRLTVAAVALSGLAEQALPEGRSGQVLDALFFAASRSLATRQGQSNCMGLSEQFSAENLLSTAGFASARVSGPPAMVSRVDAEGVMLEERYDAKETALGHSLRLLGEAVQAGAVVDLALVLDAALGDVAPCGDLDCYQSEDNPVHQLLFALLEVARYERPTDLLQTWSTLVNDNPALAEQVLVSVGAIVEAAGQSESLVSSSEAYALMETFVPVVASVFRIDTALGTMPRLLMSAVHDLSTTARDFPAKLQLSIEHTQLIKPDECSASVPKPASPLVDFTRRRYYFASGQPIDNRSTLEQSIELLAAADCGQVPFTGGLSVGEAIVDLMSRLAPDTVCNLIDNLLGLLGVTGSIGSAVVNTALTVVGCNSDGDLRAGDLFALDDLAKSGALDFYLPIAKSFRQEGEIPALVGIFSVIAKDLQNDEDDDANSESALRPLLPLFVEFLRTGVMDPFFDLNDLLVTIEAVNGDGTLADVVIDSAARLLDDTGTINTASGSQTGHSLAEEMIDALKGMTFRVEEAERTEAASRLFEFSSAYLSNTYEEQELTRLQDASLVPLLASLLQTATHVSRLPPSQYQCYLSQWQDESASWVESPGLSALLGALVGIENYSGRQELESFLARLLDPRRADTDPAPYDELLRMTAELLQTPVEIVGLDAVADYLTQTLYPSIQGRLLIRVIGQVLEGDDKRVLQRLLAAGLGPSGSRGATSPFGFLAELGQDYAAIDTANMCVLSSSLPESVPELERSVRSLVSFLQDQGSVLAGVYELLRKRSGP